jgi:hypothetical protein
MSTTENNADVAVENVKKNNDDVVSDAKAEIKGTKRPAEVIIFIFALRIFAKSARLIMAAMRPHVSNTG